MKLPDKKWLAITALSPIALYIAFPFSSPAPQSPPVSTPIPTTVAPPDILVQEQLGRPHKASKEVPALYLNEDAQAVITSSQLIKVAQLDAALAAERAKEREANGRGMQSTPVVPAVQSTVLTSNSHYALPNSTTRTPPLERITLSGMFVYPDSDPVVYLSLDGAPPFEVQQGTQIGPVRVASITKYGVTLTDGTDKRVLNGGLSHE